MNSSVSRLLNMDEIPNLDTPSPIASSLPRRPEHAPAEGNPESDDSSLLNYSGEEETDIDDDDDDESTIEDADPDDIEPEEDDDEDEDEEDEDNGTDEDYDWENPYDNSDGQLFELDDDFDMRDIDADLDLDAFGVFDLDNEERLFVDDYLDFPEQAQINALHNAFLYQLEHQIAHEHHLEFHRSLSPNMDQPRAGQGARPGAQRDELVEVEVAGQGNSASAGQRRQQRQSPPDIIDLTGDDGLEVQAGWPGRPARPAPPRPSENQRRLRSQHQNVPPRLNRSDGNYVNDQQVIVLSSSDDEDQPLRASPRRNANQHNHNHSHHNHNHAHNHNYQHSHLHSHRHNQNNMANRDARSARLDNHPQQPAPAPAPAQARQPANLNGGNHNYNNNSNLLGGRFRPFTSLMQNMPLFQFLSPPIMANRNHNPDDDDIVVTGERNIGNAANMGPLPGPHQLFGLGPIDLNYAAHPFPAMRPPVPPAGAGPPKPVHEPPKPARAGFTRDTGEDVVAICPSCDQELAYDPEDDDNQTATPTKKARSKKATAEHHFWAVKACGHVYCKRCFDNRRPSARSGVQVGFRPDDLPSKKIFCAVEDCDSEVGNKSAWVGIFM
ncbi:hypothetical protein F4678DRAFT_227144 [Xylaria arbuscula]|nr:hypothetical protein F4678DRAFT_227144 [Xylaria arbuscula]